jgi:DNA-binding HxlR family transcriptional regulator
VKSYGQWCALAKALDVVGERWTLLVIRELLDGPKRYTDLRDGIPGISTDVLAARLRELEDDGVVVRRTLRPPAASKVYDLTAMGRELAPAVAALSKWGVRLLGPRRDDDAFRPHWLVLGLRGMLRPDGTADVQLDVEFDLDSGERVRVRIDHGALTYVEEPERDPDVVVHSDLSTLAAIADGSLPSREAIRVGRLHIDGSRDAIREYGRLFPRAS